MPENLKSSLRDRPLFNLRYNPLSTHMSGMKRQQDVATPRVDQPGYDDGIAIPKVERPGYDDTEPAIPTVEPTKRKRRRSGGMQESYENRRLNVILETVSRILEAEQEGRKPDFLDFDKDGNKKEPMVKAIKDAEKKKRYPDTDPHGGVRRVRPGHGDLEQG